MKARGDPVIPESITILPDQFWDGQRTEWRGEHWLMFRVLEDAINCYLQGRNSNIVERAKLAREAYGWFMAEDYAHAFSFLNICHTLNIDASYLRRGVLGTHATRLVYKHHRYRGAPK